jgi:CHRD domain
MKQLVLKTSLFAAVLALAACSSMPSWMPFTGATKVSLTGAEEVPPVKTDGKGSGSFHIKDDGTVSGSVTTTGVAGTMAHLHMAAKGANGPVIVPLTKNGDSYSVPEGRKLTAEQLKAFKEGRVYVNVHSGAHKGGEVRAQLQP